MSNDLRRDQADTNDLRDHREEGNDATFIPTISVEKKTSGCTSHIADFPLKHNKPSTVPLHPSFTCLTINVTNLTSTKSIITNQTWLGPVFLYQWSYVIWYVRGGGGGGGGSGDCSGRSRRTKRSHVIVIDNMVIIIIIHNFICLISSNRRPLLVCSLLAF